MNGDWMDLSISTICRNENKNLKFLIFSLLLLPDSNYPVKDFIICTEIFFIQEVEGCL